MGAVTSKASADLKRRRLQTAVLSLVLFLASAVATLALNILVAANEPFERAFATATGAHLVVDFHVSIGEQSAAAGADRPDVAGSAGPWPMAVGGFGR